MINELLKKIKMNIFNIFIFIISISIIVFFVHLSRYCSFWGDDSFYAVYSHAYETYFDCLIGNVRTEHGGYYIGLFLCKFLSFGLPTLMGIHPADFVGVGHGFIRGIFTAICLYIITMFSNIYSNKKILFVTVFLFLACYFFWNGMHSNIIVINYNFYRYFFSLIFFGYFIYFLYQNMIFDERNNKSIIKLSLISLCGLIIGTSIEIAFFTIIMFVSLIILYNFFLNGIFFITQNEKIKCNKYNLDINFYLPVLFLISGIILFTTTNGFKEVAADRGLTNIAVTLTDLKEFSLLYLNICFQNEYVYWIIFILFAGISIYFSIKNQESKKIVFPLLLQISILTVIFSLVLCGKTYDEITRDRFYLHHWNIVFLYKMLILFPLFMCIDYGLDNILCKLQDKYQKIILSLFVIILLSGCFIYINQIVRYYPWSNSIWFMPKQKKMYYTIEKLYRFYTLRNEMPILPNYYNDSFGNMYPYFRNIDISKNPVTNLHLRAYYWKIYKKTIDIKSQFIIQDNALEYYYNQGGILTDKELEDLNFSKLLDDNFVLNKKSY